jgi:2-C-methyl-D-erythritol 4-phosphate cytidylyltransferase
MGLVKKMIKRIKGGKAIIPVIPVKDTIKVVKDNKVKETPKRENLFIVQTPQLFEKNTLFKAYKSKIPKHTTDDSYLVERLGLSVKTILGEEKNIKITTPQDIKIAKSLLK